MNKESLSIRIIQQTSDELKALGQSPDPQEFWNLVIDCLISVSSLLDLSFDRRINWMWGQYDRMAREQSGLLGFWGSIVKTLFIVRTGWRPTPEVAQ